MVSSLSSSSSYSSTWLCCQIGHNWCIPYQSSACVINHVPLSNSGKSKCPALIFCHNFHKSISSALLPARNMFVQGAFFDWSALKMTKYEEKLKYLNWSANWSSKKVLSVNLR